MSFSVLLGYMIVSSFTPGPGNILSMNTTTRFGWEKGKKLICGICCGYLFVQMFCTIVLYNLNKVLSPALAILKYIGAFYMVYLAVHIAISKKSEDDDSSSPRFLTGFLLQLVNVKIYFYITTLLTAYLIPVISSLPLLLLAGVGVVSIGSLASCTWAFLGIKMQSIYNKHFRFINMVLALFLVYCAYGIIK